MSELLYSKLRNIIKSLWKHKLIKNDGLIQLVSGITTRKACGFEYIRILGSCYINIIRYDSHTKNKAFLPTNALFIKT